MKPKKRTQKAIHFIITHIAQQTHHRLSLNVMLNGWNDNVDEKVARNKTHTESQKWNIFLPELHINSTTTNWCIKYERIAGHFVLLHITIATHSVLWFSTECWCWVVDVKRIPMLVPFSLLCRSGLYRNAYYAIWLRQCYNIRNNFTSCSTSMEIGSVPLCGHSWIQTYTSFLEMLPNTILLAASLLLLFISFWRSSPTMKLSQQFYYRCCPFFHLSSFIIIIVFFCGIRFICFWCS